MFIIRNRKFITLFGLRFTGAELQIVTFERTKSTDNYMVFKDFTVVGRDEFFFTYQMTELGFYNSYGLLYEDVGEQDALASIVASTRSRDCHVATFSEIGMVDGIYVGGQTFDQYSQTDYQS